MGFDLKSALKKAGKYGIRAGTAIASGGGSEIYRGATGKADPITGRAESYVDQVFGPEDGASNPYLDAFGAAERDIGAEGAAMDARRRAALEQSLAMFGPTRDLLAKWYGADAVPPPIDINALFGPLPPAPGTVGSGTAPDGWTVGGTNGATTAKAYTQPGTAPVPKPAPRAYGATRARGGQGWG